jgi:hypothetical protein
MPIIDAKIFGRVAGDRLYTPFIPDKSKARWEWVFAPGCTPLPGDLVLDVDSYSELPTGADGLTIRGIPVNDGKYP